MLKIVSLFLVFIVVVALFSRFRSGGLLPPRKPGGGSLPRPAKCTSCGRFRFGTGPCDCGAPKA